MCEARRFINLFVAVFFFLLGSAAAQETRFFLPILYGSGADLGLALSNPTAAEAAVTLTARDYSGSVIAGSQITNPVTVHVPASGQRSLRMAEIFGAGIVGKSGWTEVAASSPEIKGFFVTFDSALTFIDGADLQNRPSRRVIFQNVTAFSSTTSAVTFVNTTANTLSNVVFKVYSPTGLTGTKVFEMAPYSGFSGAVTDFIPRVSVSEPGLPGFDRGYAILEVGGSTGSVDALVGFETYRRTGDLAAMNAATDASRLRAGYLPHFATGSGYRTTLHLINASDKEQIIGVTADGIQTAGQLIPSKTTERTLLPNQFLEVDVATEFGLGGSELTTGYLRWEVPLNTEGVIGFLDYGTADGMLSAIPAQTVMGTSFLASHIAQGSGYYTGLALLNPTGNDATVDVSAFSPDGSRIGSTTFALGAGERRTRLLSELLPEVSHQLGGYVRVGSSQPLFLLQIFGSSDSLRFLANVPAQITGQAMPVPQPAPVGPPAILSQVGEVGSRLPVNSAFTLSVLVTDAAGKPVPGVAVRLSQTAGEKVVDNYGMVTGLAGLAKALLKVGSTAGTYTFVASAAGLSQTVSVTIEVEAPSPVVIPRFTEVIPSSVVVGSQNVEMTFRGTNLDLITEIVLPGITSITFRSPTEIKAKFSVPINTIVGVYNSSAATATRSIGVPAIEITTPSGIVVRSGGTTLAMAVGTSQGLTLFGPGAERIRSLKLEDDHFFSVSAPSVSAGQFNVTVSVSADATVGQRTLSIITDEGTYQVGTLNVYNPDNPSPTGICCINPVAATAGSSTQFVVTFAFYDTIRVTGFSFWLKGAPDPTIQISNFRKTGRQTSEVTLTIANDAPAGERTVVFTAATGPIVTNQKFIVITPDGSLPVIYSVSPAEARRGTLLWVRLIGSGFVEGSTIDVSGTGVTVARTSLASDKRLFAILTIQAGAPPGDRELTVTTPTGTSRIRFTVTP